MCIRLHMPSTHSDAKSAHLGRGWGLFIYAQTQVLGCVILFIFHKPNYETFIRASLDLFEY